MLWTAEGFSEPLFDPVDWDRHADHRQGDCMKASPSGAHQRYGDSIPTVIVTDKALDLTEELEPRAKKTRPWVQLHGFIDDVQHPAIKRPDRVLTTVHYFMLQSSSFRASGHLLIWLTQVMGMQRVMVFRLTNWLPPAVRSGPSLQCRSPDHIQISFNNRHPHRA